MLIEKTELDSTIEGIIDATRRLKNLIPEMEKYFHTKNIPIINVTKIVDKRLPLASFSGSSYIYMAFVIALHKFLSNIEDYKKYANKISPEKCFTPSELESYSKSVFTQEKKGHEPFIFKGFTRIDDDQYIGVIPIKTLVEMFDDGLLEYNEKTQRPFKSRVIKNGENYEVVNKININHNSVKEITESILNGTYIYDTITINVVPKENGSVDFEGSSIKIENCEYHVVDGFHRCIASAKAFMKNANIEKNWEVRLVFFDEQKANRLIVQFDKRNPIGKDAIASKDDSKLATGIVRDLNATSKLMGRISTGNRMTPNQIVKFSTVVQAIDSVFKLKSTFDLMQNKQYIIDGFNFYVDSGILPLDKLLEQSKLLLLLMLLKKHKGDDYMLKISDEFKANMEIFESIYTIKYSKNPVKVINEINKILGGVKDGEKEA